MSMCTFVFHYYSSCQLACRAAMELFHPCLVTGQSQDGAPAVPHVLQFRFQSMCTHAGKQLAVQNHFIRQAAVLQLHGLLQCSKQTACTNKTVVSKFMLSHVPAAPLIHTWHCIHTCAFSRTAVDSRINQLNEELQTIKSQHKAEVNKLRKQLDEEKVKVKQMAAKVGLIWGGLIFEWFTSCMPLSCFSAVFFQIGTECWYKILVNVRCFEKKEKKSLTA